ncbi:hypothetical protein Pcinc_023828 [Petrolisthes cinctipes]|uniref:Uncharacterized protein n=1 Tax=Petrolisthes cinctipes TaxID=88211 RepID=A0AAE1FCR5_PETCI|nr:hypothetical protein Pcinc_023828 [Petrolisthes cinctipes]
MLPGTGICKLRNGCCVSELGCHLWTWLCFSGRMQARLRALYVDDFLWVDTQNFERQVIEPVNKAYMVGSSESKSFRYLGLNIISEADGSMTLDQFQYASSLLPITISRQRAMMKTGELSESEKTEYRALIGQLNWIATHTRPDIL